MTEHWIHAHRVIPVVELDDPSAAVPLAEALAAGGINIIEITLRTDAGVDAIAAIRSALPEMHVGAGTVLTEDDARRVIDAGAQFGVAPGVNPATIGIFTNAGLPFLPGIMTPTEIEAAMHCGCDLLKFFPAAAAGGPAYLNAIAGPYRSRGITFCATGGVGPANMVEYLRSPLISAIGGSWLATRQQIAERAWDQITAESRAAISQLTELEQAQAT